jgi:type I restriction enzyme S subunit
VPEKTTAAQDNFKETEIGPIPTDWDIVPFQEAILNKRIHVGKVKKRDYKPKGKFPIIDQSQEFIGGYWDDSEAVYSGDLPIIIFGDHTRIFKLIDFPFVRGADGVKVLLPDRDKYDPQFFYFACTNLEIPSKGYSRHYKLLKEQLLPCPSLPEQRRIAHVLSTIQRAIAAQDDLIAAARELKRSLMQRLFTCGPGPEPAPTKEREIGKVPEHWEVVRLGKVVEHSFSGGTPSTKRPQYWDGNIPWTTSATIGGDDVILSRFQRTITELGLDRSASKIAPRGSLMVGTRVGVGKAVVPEFDIAMSQDLTALVLKSYANAEFLACLFKSAPLQREIQGRTRGTTIKGIPRKDLLTLVISLPPLPEQQEIVRILTVVDRKIKAEEQRKAALQALFKSMLHQLMTGQVRV